MYMKFSFSFLLGAGLLLLAACKQQDSKLVAKVEAEIQRWQSELGQYENIGASLEKFQQEVDAAIPSQAGLPADSLKMNANTMVTKERAAIATYKQGITTLTNRLAEYQAGTVEKEALQIEVKAVKSSLLQMDATFKALQEQQRQLQTALSARRPKQPAQPNTE